MRSDDPRPAAPLPALAGLLVAATASVLLWSLLFVVGYAVLA